MAGTIVSHTAPCNDAEATGSSTLSHLTIVAASVFGAHLLVAICISTHLILQLLPVEICIHSLSYVGGECPEAPRHDGLSNVSPGLQEALAAAGELQSITPLGIWVII